MALPPLIAMATEAAPPSVWPAKVPSGAGTGALLVGAAGVGELVVAVALGVAVYSSALFFLCAALALSAHSTRARISPPISVTIGLFSFIDGSAGKRT